MREIRRPWRFLWLVPIWMMCGLFEDQLIATLFAFAMAYVTAKIFPWIEYVKDKQ